MRHLKRDRHGEMEFRTMVLLAALIIIFAPVAYVLLMNPTPSYASFNIGVNGPSYTIFNSDGVTYAQSGLTGETQYSDSNSGVVIQDAINGLGSRGGEVFIKAGLYLISSPITISKPSVAIVGEGDSGAYDEQATELRASGTPSDIIIFNQAEDPAVTGITIKSMDINGAFTGTNGISLYDCVDSSFSDLRIYRCHVALNLIGAGKSLFSAIRCEINDYGICMNRSALGVSISDLAFDRLTLTDNNIAGIFSEPSGATMGIKATFTACTIESNHKWGAYFYNAGVVSFYGCTFESNNKDNLANVDDLHVEYATQRDGYITVQDTLFTGTDVTRSIFLSGCNHVILERDYFNDVVLADYCRYGLVEANKFDATPTFTGDVHDFTIMDNTGYITHAWGTAKILNGATSAVINHGLTGTPAYVTLTPMSLQTSGISWDTNTGTSFTVHVVAPVTGDSWFTWEAWF